MLRQMRETFHNLRWALVAVVAAIVVGFVFIDMGLGGGAVASEERTFAARVNGETITYNDYYRALKNFEQMYSQAYGQQFTPEMAAAMGLPQQVIQRLVDQRLLAQEASRLNLDPTPQEIRAKLLTIPTFTQDGKFVGMELYTRYVTGPLGYPTAAAFEDDLARDIALEKMESALESSIMISRQAADAEYRRANESARIRYVLLPAAQAAGNVTPAEVEAHYKANQAKYAHGEQRRVHYLLADYNKIRTQITPTPEELRKVYDAEKENYRRPGSAHVQHILVKVDPGASAEADAAARAKAQSIVQQLRGGADFATLARQHSEDPSSASSGGDMGWVDMGQTVEPFERAIFSIALNTISDPIRSQEYGYHIVKVVDRRESTVRGFDEVRPELASRVQTDKARDVARAEINRIHALVRQNKPGTPEAFGALANEKVTSNDGGWIGRNEQIAGIGAHKPLNEWVFSAKPGAISDPIGTPRGIAIAYVSGERAPGVAPLADVREQVEADVRQAKGREAARAALAQTMSGASAIDEVAAKAGQPVREANINRQGTVAGLSGDVGPLVDAAMSGKVGGLAGPVAVGDGAVAFEILEQKKVTDEELAQNRKTFVQTMREQQARNLRTVLIERLRKKATIQINDEITRPTTAPAGI